MDNNEKLKSSVAECARLLGLSRNGAYAACLSGAIHSIRIGKRVLIPKESLSKLLRDVQPAAPVLNK